MNKIPKKEAVPVILFDSDCLICNRFIHFVIKNDKRNRICFAGLNSTLGIEKRAQLPEHKKNIDSIIFCIAGHSFFYSTAILNILKQMGGFWMLVGRLCWFIPKFLRDWIYRIFAQKRYIFFSEKTYCKIPSPEVSSRFL